MKSLILKTSVLLVLVAGVALAAHTVRWFVVSSGAVDGSSHAYQLKGTVNQNAVGPVNSESYFVSQGYWRRFGPSYVCGDADANKLINISDAVYLIGFIFGGGPAPDPTAAADADCNGIVNISDAVYLIAYIFGGGSAPCAGCP